MPKGEEIKNYKKKSNYELSKELKKNKEEYFKSEKNILKAIEFRRKTNKKFLSDIKEFIEYINIKLENNHLDGEIREKYLDLIEEEQSLHDRIQQDIKHYDKMIESIKKSTNGLSH